MAPISVLGEGQKSKSASSEARSGRGLGTTERNSGRLSAKLLKNGTLKTYKNFPHGMPTTQADIINADLLAFFKA